SLLCGFVGFGLGAVICNHAAALVLVIIEGLVRLSVRLPGAFVPAHFSSAWVGPITLMILIATLLAGYATGWQRKYGGCWPPFIVVTLVLIFGVKFGVE